MIQHTDNKPRQRLGARPITTCQMRGGTCVHPFMMINDLGKTFGTARFPTPTEERRQLQEWSKRRVEGPRVRGCCQIVYRTARASEDQRRRRKFLSDLLAQR
jgi:hypothetical protein